MATLTPSRSTGATTRRLPSVYVEPGSAIDGVVLAQPFADTHLNGVFCADLLSAVLAHERCGVHLYRSVAGRSHNPMLVRKYREFAGETAQHVVVLEGLLTDIGGDPQYVSPMARRAEALAVKVLESTYLFNGSSQVMEQEMAMLEAVLVAETTAQANWSFLSELTSELKEGDLRDRLATAVGAVQAYEEARLTWALTTRSKMRMLQARSSKVTTAEVKVEELVVAVRNWFS